MRIILGCVIAAIFCIVVFSNYTHASQDRPLRQNYTISINVECIETATVIVRTLPGYNLDSSTTSGEWQRTAEFRRRVHSDSLRYVQATLRDLGEVIRESENAQHLGTGIMDLDVRIIAANQELERLTAIMEASTSLDVLIAVNDRINTVARNRDDLIGRLNVMMVDSQGPIVNITLIENLPGRPAPPPEGFGARIRESFGSSLRSSRNAAATFIVGVVRVFLPLIIWVAVFAAIGFAAWRLFVRKMWLKSTARKTAPQSPIENRDDIKEGSL